MLRTLLLAAATVAAVAAEQRAAIVFTDVKLDDKVAIDHLRCSGIYSHVAAIISGVEHTEGAHSDLIDFLNEMDLLRLKNAEQESVPVECAAVIVMGVESMNQEPAPHEVNFIGNELAVPSFVDHFDGWLQTATIDVDVDIYQIAPTHEKYVEIVSDSDRVRVGRYHLVHGYNSKQWDDSGEESVDAQHEFLANLPKYIRSKNSNAEVVFTNNFASFNPPGAGSSQLYSAVKPFLPEHHLEAALNDPFHRKKLRQLEKSLNKFNTTISATLFPTSASYGGDVHHTDEFLQALVLEARKNENGPRGEFLREHFSNYITEALTALKDVVRSCERDMSMLFRVKNAVLPAFSNPLSVELCDANHIAAVVDIMEGRNTIRGMCKQSNVCGMRFVKNGKGFLVFARDAEAKKQLMLHSLESANCLELLTKSFPKPGTPTL